MKKFYKQTQYITTSEGPIFSSFSEPSQARDDKLTLILLHGAGKSHSGLYGELAQLFLSQGVSVVMLDFLGHGQTAGNISESSLAVRTKHAISATNYWVNDSAPLIICGSSMSGHTALRVTSALAARVKSLGLLQPAVYAKEAEEVFFGPDFTQIIRQPGNWRSSPALDDARQFSGKSLAVIGSEDQIIPEDVFNTLSDALKQKSKQTLIKKIHGVAHELPTWLPNHPEISDELVQFLTEI